MFITRRQLLAAGAAASMPFAVAPSRAQARHATLRILVGFPAGSTPDVLARKIGDHLLRRDVAPAVVVENRLGAGGQLAVVGTKIAPADGNTLLLTPMSMLGVYPHTYRKLPYDPVADLSPVAMGASFDYGIGVGPAVPEHVGTLQGLLDWYRSSPHKNIASPAVGSTLHFVAVMLGRAAGVDIQHVPYKGSGPAIQDMLGGSIPAMCAPLGAFLHQPRLRLLASSGARRSPFAPQVPTLAEQGFKDMVFSEWYGFYLPAKAAHTLVARLNAALTDVLAQKDVVETLASFGMEATPSTPAGLGAALKADLERWGAIVKSVGFTADS